MEAGKTVHMGHPGLVGLPILLTAAFCFAMVLTNPADRAATSKSSQPADAVSSKPPAHLSAEPMAKKHHHSSSGQKTAKPSGLSVARSSGGGTGSTGTPQQGEGNPQRAVQYHESGTLDRVRSLHRATTKKSQDTPIQVIDSVVDGLLH